MVLPKIAPRLPSTDEQLHETPDKLDLQQNSTCLSTEAPLPPVEMEQEIEAPCWTHLSPQCLNLTQLSSLQRFKSEFHYIDYLRQWIRLTHNARTRMRQMHLESAPLRKIAAFTCIMERCFAHLADQLGHKIAQAHANLQPRPNFEAVLYRCTSLPSPF